MIDTAIASLVIDLLGAVAKAAPGYLALLTGKQSDEEALKHAKEKIDAIPRKPAGSVIDDGT